MALLRRRPHPARGSRVLTTGVSLTAFMSIVSTFLWNAQVAAATARQTASVDAFVDDSIPDAAPRPTPTIQVIKKVTAKSKVVVSAKPVVKKVTVKAKSKTKTTTTTCHTKKGGKCR